MSLSQLFAKPLTLIPPRKKLWASPHPIHHFEISEKSKNLPKSKAAFVETASPNSKPKNKITEKDYHKSVLYPALRRPTVQEFLLNEYQKNPKRPYHVSDLTDSRQQSQMKQRIANLSKAKVSHNSKTKLELNEKRFQPSFPALQDKNTRNTNICPLSGGTVNRNVNSVEMGGPPSTSGTPKGAASSDIKSAVTVSTSKDSSNNKNGLRPRFKTIVKNGSMVTIRLPPLKSNQPSKKNKCTPEEVGKTPVTLATPKNTPDVVSLCINKNSSQNLSFPRVSDYSRPQNESNLQSCQGTINSEGKGKAFKLKEDVIPNTNKATEETELDDVNQESQNKAVNKTKLLNLVNNKQKTSKSTKTSVVSERLTMKQDLDMTEETLNISTKSKDVKKLHTDLTLVRDGHFNKYQKETIVGTSQVTESKYSPKQRTCFSTSVVKELHVSLDLPCLNERQMLEEQETLQRPNNSQSSNETSNLHRLVDGNKLEIENSVEQLCNSSVLERNGKLMLEHFDNSESSVTEQACSKLYVQQQKEVSRLNINDSKTNVEQNINTSQVDKILSENIEHLNNAMTEHAFDKPPFKQLEKDNISDIDDSKPYIEHSTDSNVETLYSGNSKKTIICCVTVKTSDNLCLNQQEKVKKRDFDETKITVEHNENTKMDKNCIDSGNGNESFKKDVPKSDFTNSQNTEIQALDNLSESDVSLAELTFPGSDSQGEDDQEEIMRDKQLSVESAAVFTLQKAKSSDGECEEGEITSSSEELEVTECKSESKADLVTQRESTECKSESKTDPISELDDVSLKGNSYKTRSKSHNVGRQKQTLGKNGTQVSKQAEKNAKTDTITQKKKMDHPYKGQDKRKTKPKEPSLLDSVADVIVDVTVAADEKLDNKKKRGGSKEALKRKKKLYKARKRKLTWNKLSTKSQVKFEALPPPVCKYYLMGGCNKGNECSFAHEGEVVIVKKKEVCKYYTTGCCTKGDDCHFMHSEFPCMFFYSSRCYRGDNCKFSHGPLTEEMKQALNKYIQENKQREAESQVTTENEKRHSGMEEDNPGVQHVMLLRSQVHLHPNSVNMQYSPGCTPKNESSSNEGAVSENSKTDAALEVQSPPYNLRRKRSLNEESELSLKFGQKTPKAPKKDDGTTGNFFPGMYREQSS